jgi:hypothetical protein
MMGLFMVVALTNHRRNKGGNFQMSENQKQMAEEYIQAKKTGGRFLLGGPGYLQTFAEGGTDDDPGSDDDDADDDDQDDDDQDDGDDQDDDGIDFEYSRGSIDAIMKTNNLDFNQLLKDNPGLKKHIQTDSIRICQNDWRNSMVSMWKNTVI